MTEFTSEDIAEYRKYVYLKRMIEGKDFSPIQKLTILCLDHIERQAQRIAELEIQLKSKDIIINNQQGRLNYYATKDLLGGKNERNTR